MTSSLMGRYKNAAFICENRQIDISLNYISKILSLSPIICSSVCLLSVCVGLYVLFWKNKCFLKILTHSLGIAICVLLLSQTISKRQNSRKMVLFLNYKSLKSDRNERTNWTERRTDRNGRKLFEEIHIFKAKTVERSVDTRQTKKKYNTV